MAHFDGVDVDVVADQVHTTTFDPSQGLLLHLELVTITQLLNGLVHKRVTLGFDGWSSRVRVLTLADVVVEAVPNLQETLLGLNSETEERFFALSRQKFGPDQCHHHPRLAKFVHLGSGVTETHDIQNAIHIVVIETSHLNFGGIL